ncbi:hypothetical protein Sipo7851_10015 [Streptomyces ipomoeae]|nr:hypothetical protein Sipo7851_10015 [Streptomyces ipomoeae]
MVRVRGPRLLRSRGRRLPFLPALPLGLAGLWLRLRLDETPALRHEGGLGAGTGPRGRPCDRPRRRARHGANSASAAINTDPLSSAFHPGLIRWPHDAGDSSRLVPRPRADE